MPSHFGWVDFTEQDRQRMLDIIQLFREPETRDELGIGTIRDAFANHFFPGTSTIQTRARYMFFVPWIYLGLERKGVPSAGIAGRARGEEIGLIFRLLEGGETEGVIGKEAKKRLQRLPSAIYWSGLWAWGIRLFPGSQDQYHRSLDWYYRRQRSVLRGDDNEPLDGLPAANWHPGLPRPPEDFPKSATFALNREEAEYLRERIRMLHGSSLLSIILEHGELAEADFLWEHPVIGAVKEDLRREADQARNFSEAIFGAVLLYNLLLSRRKGNEEWVEFYESELDEWGDLLTARWGELTDWYRHLDQFWSSRTLIAGRIPQGTVSFANHWLRLVFETSGAHGAGRRLARAIADDLQAKNLIYDREHQLKKNRARLHNDRALELWSGAAGAYRLDYRWGIALEW